MINLREFPNKVNLFPIDENGREINFYSLNHCIFNETFYPNIIIFSEEYKWLGDFYNPIDETIMSLKKAGPIQVKVKKISEENKVVENNPVFFFIFNTDNYYHFVYDSLPYLITYSEIKQKVPNLKLLMNYPNSQSNKIYPFVYEFLELLEITKEDIIIVDKNTLYKEIYFSDSYTHGIDSNLPPRKEIYDLYETIVKNAIDRIDNRFIAKNLYSPYKIYISRRTHLHNDFSNIGTNYTSRRKCINEDELVIYLKEQNYEEIFTEKLTIIEKIWLFKHATHIIGALGGGMVNLLFCKPTCKVIGINSPTVLDVNKRYIHFLNRVDYKIFNDTSHVEKGEFKKFMRVKFTIGGKEKLETYIGEIIDIKNNEITIQYLNEQLAGWSNSIEYKTYIIHKDFVEKIDNGLNSAWELNMDKFKELDI